MLFATSVPLVIAFPRFFNAPPDPYTYVPEQVQGQPNAGFLLGIVKPPNRASENAGFVPMGFPILEGATNFLRSGAYNTLGELANIRSSLAAAGTARLFQEAELIKGSAQRVIEVGEKVTSAAASGVRSFENQSQKVEEALHNATLDAVDRLSRDAQIPEGANVPEMFGEPAGGVTKISRTGATDSSLLGSALEITSRVAENGVSSVLSGLAPSQSNVVATAASQQYSSPNSFTKTQQSALPTASPVLAKPTDKHLNSNVSSYTNATVRHTPFSSDAAYEGLRPRALQRRRKGGGPRRATTGKRAERAAGKMSRASKRSATVEPFVGSHSNLPSSDVSYTETSSSYFTQPAVPQQQQPSQQQHQNMLPDYVHDDTHKLATVGHGSDLPLMESHDYFPPEEDLGFGMYGN